MKKFLLGLVSGLVLTALGGVIVFFAMVRLSDRKPSVPRDATLLLQLSGSIPEQAPTEIPLPMFESRAPVTMIELWDLLRKAEKDSRIRAIVLEPHGLAVGWAGLEELRGNLVKFKRSGKPVYAYLRNPGAREYYLATAADKIYFEREDLLDLKGLRAEITYYRRILDKIGVQVEVEHAGKYKDAADSYVRDNMSPETREVMNGVLDQIFGDIVNTIASSRGKTPEQVRAIIDEGPFLAAKAQEKGLVDGLIYEDQVFEEMKLRLKQTELHKISHRDYLKIPSGSLGLDGATKVAFVVGEGTITRGGDSDPFGSEEGIRSVPFMKMLRQVAEDSSIRGVILRVNSPGGDAIASDEILHEVRNLSRRKATVISMGDVAASGGYYIAMSGDPVLAYPNTFTGSIGVIFGKVNLKGLYDKLGLNTEVMTRGRFADIDSSIKPMDETARKKLKEGIDTTYQTFLTCVAEGRKRKIEDIAPLAQGRVWMGADAKSKGLVDDLGGIDRSIELVRKKAGMGSDEKIHLVTYPRRKTIFEQIFGSNEQPTAQMEGAEKVRQLKALVGLEDFDLSLWRKGGIMRLAPYRIRVQ